MNVLFILIQYTHSPEKMNSQQAQQPDELLFHILQTQQHESLLSLTSDKIREQNGHVLEPLCSNEEEWMAYMRQVEGYRFIDNAAELTMGAFIRWMNITDPEHLSFQHCGMICDIKTNAQGEVYVTCKNFMHRHYTFKMDECLVFQKLSAQEKVVLQVLDQLADE